MERTCDLPAALRIVSMVTMICQRNESLPDPATVTRPDGTVDWDKATQLGWRPAWAIRSRRGSVAPFFDMVSQWWRNWRNRQARRADVQSRDRSGPAT